MQKGKKGKGKSGNRPPKNMSKKQVNEFTQLKNRMLKELLQETKSRGSRQQVKLSQRPKRQSKYQNLSGVKGTRQNQGFGNKKRIIVKETEYIGEVTVSNEPNFQNIFALPCNPGQSSTFPWLYTIAKNYEKYRFLELCFFYKPEVTEFTANVNTGKVILSADYDASDAPPSSKQQMEDVDPHADGMPYQSIMLALDPKEMFQMSNARYVRIGGVPGATDIKTYDCANFFLAVSGQSANSTIGELHVRYTVELSVPVIEDTVMAPANNSVSQFVQPYTSLTSNVAATIPFSSAVNANAATANAAGIVNGLNIANATGVFTPPAGNYLVSLVVQCYNGAGTSETALVNFNKNGAPYPVALNATAQFGTGSSAGETTTDFLVPQYFYVSCNGTDTISAVVTVLFSGGTENYTAIITFVAI